MDFNFLMYLIYIALAVMVLSGIGFFFIVKQQTAFIVERFGKFQSVRHAGFQLKVPFVDRVAGKLSLKVQQLDVVVETKTKDDVFVKLKVSVQYVVIKDKVYDLMFLTWLGRRFRN